MTKPKIHDSWEVHLDNTVFSGKTKEEVLKRASGSIKKREAEGLSWQLHHVWATERTKPWPKVLIVGSSDGDCGRPADSMVAKFSNDEKLMPKGRLMWTDSAGTRSVFWYTESTKYSPNYEKDAMDLPAEVFLKLGSWLDLNKVPVHLLLRREDPGLGIFLEEDTPENGFSYREDVEEVETLLDEADT